ncbi:MAG: hypothetical protein IPM41_06865 [Sphingomonadales bacterium]|nr:hypothetical protein [Sphingomonadales bacterium]
MTRTVIRLSPDKHRAILRKPHRAAAVAQAAPVAPYRPWGLVVSPALAERLAAAHTEFSRRGA